MKTYLLSVAGVVLIGALATSVLPNGKSTKTLNALIRLCCLIVILTPLIDFFMKFRSEENFSLFSETSVINGNLSFIEYCCDERVEEAEQFLENSIGEKYKISAKVTLIVDDSSDGVKILSAKVLSDCDEETKSKIAEFLSTEYGIRNCEVENER